ncbi:MBL fold metallo-hydrolase [Haladaptatus sp. CMSO5]|uniref:MBL fold metallo-hydrolase n=1 Tax=Haladaptatus sp. CMSO5 TaxID=3120514 RepID=UPI002FCDE2C6
MSNITPSEVSARLRDGDGNLHVLDIRNRDEYEEWHIEGSHNIPVYNSLSAGQTQALRSRLSEIPDDAEIATVCIAGIVSQKAAAVLRDEGYDAKSMEGGMRGWGTVYEPYDTGVAGLTQIVRPGTGCLSYVFADDGEALVVDPALHAEIYQQFADNNDLDIVGVLDTHAHADHISSGPRFSEYLDVPYYLSATDAHDLSGYTPVEGGDTIAVGSTDLEVWETPGHTRGSVVLRLDGAILAGDTLFVRSVGRPDLEGGTAEATEGANLLFDSLDRLDSLPDDTMVYPGHFSNETIRPVADTIAAIRARNDLFGVADKSDFVETILEDLPDTPNNYNQIKAINTGKEPLTQQAADLELGPNNCASN